MSTFERCKAWVHWVGLEKDPGEDRALMADDIKKLLDVVDAARKTISAYIRIAEGGPIIPANDIKDLSEALKNLDDARRG